MKDQIKRALAVHDRIAENSSILRIGEVWCWTCRQSEKVDSADCLRSGWPKCCGSTMSLDRPPRTTKADEAVDRAWENNHGRDGSEK